ncbi:MAG: hypothetical protein ABIT71_18310 [Vicinamibacteraceae bacterium]
MPWRRSAALLSVLAVAGCRQPSSPGDGRYLVTSTALQVGLSNGMGLCIAVDPRDSHGIWWWEPGASGCATRSTGTILHANEAVVSRSTEADVITASDVITESDVITVAFRLGLHSRTPSFLDVRLVVEDGHMRTLDRRARVPVHRRQDLDMRWELPAPR